MNLPELAIKRPVFITSIFVLILAVGGLSVSKLGVDLFPNISFPIISVTTIYPGAGPKEIETLVSKPMEDSLSTLSGLKRLRSINQEGVSVMIAEFTLSTDIKYAEQQIRDRISLIKSKLPDDVLDPVVRAIDPSDQPVLTLAVTADLPAAQIYDVADQDIRPLLEQVTDVGLVEVVGGRKREIKVNLDRKKLEARRLTAVAVAGQLGAQGKNVPAGTLERGDTEAVVRTLGEFSSLKDIENTIISFFGNETPTRVRDVATVEDGLVDESSRTFVNGKQALTLQIYRRSGSNTIAVVDATIKRVEKIKTEFKDRYPGFGLEIVRDGAKPIRANVDDVTESIIIGIILTILVVFIFLGSIRSTLITGIALPNSLLGAFILMAAAGFTINMMTLLALSLAVGLLIDDAIVVRENIFRRIELGDSPEVAAKQGTHEVTMAVVATTLTVIAVFGPVAFLDGIVGQFFKEFGLTICFAMVISLFDALTMAPMLSAYMAGNPHAPRKSIWAKSLGWVTDTLDAGQTAMENVYVRMLRATLKRPILVMLGAVGVFVFSIQVLKDVPKTFMPAQDTGEFAIVMDTPPGTTLEKTYQVAAQVDAQLRTLPEIELTRLRAGGTNGEANLADIYVKLKPSKERERNTTEVKAAARDLSLPFTFARPMVQDISPVAGMSEQPFNVNIIGDDLDQVEKVATALYEKLKDNADLQDVDVSYRPGKPETQITVDKDRAMELGVSPTMAGIEMRTRLEGATPAVFREAAREYDIRVQMRDDQIATHADLRNSTVPNLNQRPIRLSQVATVEDTVGPATIYRQDRGRYIRVSAALNPDGKGLASAISTVRTTLSAPGAMPPGVRYQLVGQAENFEELAVSMAIAGGLAILFIYLVLASLYESFVTPFTIMLVLPLAACGAFFALALMHSQLDIFSMIGCILLLGIATKNSILLVDRTHQLEAQGTPQVEAILEAGRTRLRPILMTSLALIAGMLPVAIGLNEASRQRTSMGIAVIGGLISSTLLTLVVIPAAYGYIERFRALALRVALWIGGTKHTGESAH